MCRLVSARGAALAAFILGAAALAIDGDPVDVGGSDAAAACPSRPSCPAAALGEDVRADSGAAVELLQRSLWYRSQERRAAGALAAGPKPEAFPCAQLAKDSSAWAPPLPPKNRAELEVFTSLGLLSRPPHPCTSASMDSVLSLVSVPRSDAEIASRNYYAKLCSGSFVVVVAIAIAWSVLSIIMVPMKRHHETKAPPRLNLADEEKAWKTGWWHWVSLSWVDTLIGRYGKCLAAVANDEEFATQDSELSPFLRLKQHWADEVKKKGADQAWLSVALFKTVGWKPAVALTVSTFIELLFALVLMVVALDWFLRYLEDLSFQYLTEPDSAVDLLGPSVVIVVLLFGVPFAFRCASITVALLDGYYCTMCSAGLGSLVFAKAMRLPLGDHPPVRSEDDMDADKDPLKAENAEKNEQPNVVQILNVDIVETWTSLLKTTLQTAFSVPISIALFVMVIQKLGTAGLIGFLYVVPCTILTMFAQLTMVKYWIRYQGYQDVRMRILVEVLLHIRTIKSLAWEELSYKTLNDARLAELKCSQQTVITGGVTMALLHTMPWFSMLTALGMTVKLQGDIRASQIILVQRLMMSLLVSLGIMQIGLRKVAGVPNSFRRIRTFLMQAEAPEGLLQPVGELEPEQAPHDSGMALRAQGSFTYVVGRAPAIKGLDITVRKGELVGVIGEVASGKSTLLHVLIGELFPVDGATIESPGAVGRSAFCAQVPWIFEGTMKENILASNSFDAERYKKVLYSAALLPDLRILPGGDLVTIGSNGIRLSGGQRARVALARAAYSQTADVVFIDDPFASVDVPTGDHLLNELLLGELMKGRTQIVVTQPSVRLHKFDRVLLMKDGAVVRTGTPAEVMATAEYAALLANESEAHRLVLAPATTQGAKTADQAMDEISAMVNSTPNTLRDAEAQEYITWDSLKWWFRAAGIGNLSCFLLFMLTQRFFTLRANLSLAAWVNMKSVVPVVDDQHYMLMTLKFVGMFFFNVILVAYQASRVSIRASTTMHETVVGAIMRASVDKFWDKTPVGRLINRLSNDMRQVDDYIPLAGVALFTFLLGVFVTQGFVLSVMPLKIALLSMPFYSAVIFFMYVYRGTSVPLVFHTKFALSMLQDMQAVAFGMAVSVRANGMTDHFVQQYNSHVRVIIRCQYLCAYVCRAWVQSRVFLCLCLLTCLFALGGLWNRMPMGTLATVVTLLFEQMVEFEGISVVFTGFLNILNALQRLTNYFRIPQEAPAEMPNDPKIRLRARLRRSMLPRLEIRRGPEAEACLPKGSALKIGGKCVPLVVCHRGVPVIKASDDNLCLELLEGATLAELFPECEDLRNAREPYHIVAVNSVTKDAASMAEELCNPPAHVWLDLWHGHYASGLRIVLDDLTAGYGRDVSVLSKVHVDIPERCKVGFAGQTGCGKSTTLLCILRVLELRGGRILMGNIDISKIGLNTLRNIVGLVPQDPTVFAGTWRTNIDPYSEFPEGRIWEALRSVQLLPYIRGLPGGLDFVITHNGGNISFGQRQLLSLARMVIRQPPVLLLDECTSSLDPNTQQVVQNTVLNEFPLSSIIAIAHRVETILDFDRIVVFDQGTVAEQGTVQEVLAIQNGIFRRMVEGAKGIKTAAN